MQPDPLELYTTGELVKELMRRKTFLGVIVHSEQELKEAWKGERTFKVHFNSNLDRTQASRLLETVADYMQRSGC